MITDAQSKKLPASLAELVKSDLAGLNRLREGDVLEVELLRKSPRRAYFDINKFGTGVVFGVELSNAREIIKALKVGERLPAKIESLNGEDGYIELSLVEADKQRLWQQALDLQESGEIVAVKVAAANAGGLIVNLCDLKAFLPVSQLSNDHYPKNPEGDRQKSIDELKKFVGQDLNVKVINVNPRNNKFIVSERETMNENIKELLANYQIGQVVDGLVSGIADFGIFVRFVDNPQIEGLVHISEIDHRLIDNPKETVNLNEAVKVKIIDIREGRVFLSLKALRPDPWEKVGDHYRAGQEVTGKIYKFNPFGAIVSLGGNIQGMIHVSEFGGLDEMKKALAVGEAYPFVIDSIRPQEKRLILKLKK